MNTTRVLIVDDYEGWRHKIRRLLQDLPEFQVICEGSDGVKAVEKAEELKPDLILLDIGLPRLNGIEAARKIRQLCPSSRIIFLSMDNSYDVVQGALSTGAWGYVYKPMASDLLRAIEVVQSGKRYVSDTVEDSKFAASIIVSKFSEFIANALDAGSAAIAVVKNSHRESLLRELKAGRVDTAAAIQKGTLIFLDVVDIPSTLLEGGLSDRVRFVEIFSPLIDTASRATKAEHPKVAFCCEGLGRPGADGPADLAGWLKKGFSHLENAPEVDLLCAYSDSISGEHITGAVSMR